MGILIGVFGIAVMLGLAWLLSNNKSKINYKAVGIMLGMQFVLGYLMLNTKTGLTVLNAVGGVFNKLIGFGMEGINFVVGGWIPEGNAPFFVNVLMVIIFTSVVLSVLTHLRVLPLMIKYIGGGLAKVTGLPQIESFIGVASIFFGQSEVFLMIRNQLDTLHKNRLFIVSASAMGSVSASIVGAYMAMIPAQYVLTAMVLNMFSALILASIVSPVQADKNEKINIKDIVQTKNIFEAISQGAIDGGKVALIVSAMLVAYVGLMALINSVLTGMIGVDLQTILGFVFAPVAFLMGVPVGELVQVGGFMGTKLVTNEFVAMLGLQEVAGSLSPKALAIVSTYLVSFSNFSSIGIIAGSVQALNGAKASEVSAFGLKLLLVASLASALSATIVGLFM